MNNRSNAVSGIMAKKLINIHEEWTDGVTIIMLMIKEAFDYL